MKRFRKTAAVLAAASLCLGILSGCETPPESSGPAPQNSFDEFVEGLPQKFLSSDNLNLNYTFLDPSAYGFEETLLELPFSTREDYEQSRKEIDDLKKELELYKREIYSDEQVLTYQVIEDYLNRLSLTLPYYELDNNYLGSFIGFQAQLPLLLNEFTINRKNDVESYLHLLETSGEAFQKYADMEKHRQETGVGMSQKILDKVIGQCNTFADGDVSFLVDSITEKINQADFLTEEEKQSYGERAKTLTEQNLREAYRALGESLSSIEAAGQDLGLSALPDGKQYYEALVRQKTGIDLSIEEIKTYLTKKEKQFETELSALLMDPGVYNRVKNNERAVYTSLPDAVQVLDFLREKVSEDFPALPSLKFKIVTVPEAMKDYFSPAAYLQSPIDAPSDWTEAIYLNQEYDQSLFPTLMHEGYPGHMYQNVYFKNLQLPAIRYLMDYTGYSEGWATYVENRVAAYVQDPADQKLAAVWQANTKIVQALLARADIGIHYEGWTRDDFYSFWQENFSSADRESCDEQYDLFLETPANYMQYYLDGMYFEDLYTKAEDALGAAFSPAAFHQVILETGPSSFAILQEQVDRYISQTRKNDDAVAA